MGIAINIKMSALLMVPGYVLTIAMEGGLINVVVSLVIMVALQVLIGLEFILANKDAYFSMAYNFDRVFMMTEQVNFQFLTQDFMHSKEFNNFLLAMHLLFLVIFLFFKWTSLNPTQFLKEIKLYPVSQLCASSRQMCQYKKLLIIFSSNLIGVCFSRGTHQQFYSWYNYTFAFLADAALGDWYLSKLMVILCLETAWSVAKPRNASQSYLLNFAHIILVYGLLKQQNFPTFSQAQVEQHKKVEKVEKTE